MSRASVSARDYQLVSSFEAIKATLLSERYRDRLSKPLAYWALPKDRRLPLAFLNKSIGELLNTPFDELAATPGIGQKKISSLVKLLMRATKDQPPMVPFGLNELAEERGVNLRLDPGSGFNAFLVSEALWSEWTRVVRELKLGDERLGRVADSLKSMPTVIWSRTLGEYENLTLAEIRGLRTHGEKRVRCVLQVFHKVYEETQRSRHEGVSQLRRRLGSQRILAISSWIGQQLASHRLPSFNDVLKNLAEPILAQIEIDCGQTVHRIARQRLGVDAEAMSVRDQAHAMGVTRARVYQLLDDCHKVVEVRWPQGKQQLDQLTGKLGAHLGTQPEDASLFLAVRQLCFPDRSQPESRSQVHSSTRTSSAP